jgi:hypothetical protein
MSFADDVDLEAQIPYSDSPEFVQLSEKIASGLFEVNSHLVKLQSWLKALSKKRDDVSLEERTVKLADTVREKVKQLSESIRSLRNWSDALPAQRFTQQKLSREFGAVLSEFQDIQKNLAEIERSSIIRAKSNIAARLQEEEETGEEQGHEHADLVQEQSQPLNQQEVDYQQTLIAERESEIQEIEQGIEELNEIFTDLGTIVAEQGTIIGKFDNPIW